MDIEKCIVIAFLIIIILCSDVDSRSEHPQYKVKIFIDDIIEILLHVMKYFIYLTNTRKYGPLGNTVITNSVTKSVTLFLPKAVRCHQAFTVIYVASCR